MPFTVFRTLRKPIKLPMLVDSHVNLHGESFADDLDAIAAISREAAQSALAPLTLHHDLRLAIDALAREAAR